MGKRSQVSDNEDSSSETSLVDVSFDFFSPNSSVDYQAIKRLLQQLFGRDAELFNLHELTELILEQDYIGSTIKTDGEESDPYALLTVLNMHLHHQHPSMKALAQYCLSKSQEESSSSLHAELQSLFSQSEKHIGLVICERLINMPVEVVPPLYNMLRDEVRNSIAANLPFKFSHLLFISRTYHLSLEEESILENTLPASQARKKKTRTKRQRPEGTDGTGKFGDAGRPEDGIYSFHAEDALLSSLGSHTLNYKYTTPPPETHQEKRGKDAFGLDVRGRMILVPMDIKSPSSDAMETDGTQDAWDVIAEQMMKVYGVSS